MSKYFELLQGAGMDLQPSSTVHSVPHLEPVEVHRGGTVISAPTEPKDPQSPEWMKGLQIVAKRWRLSAAFAAIVLLTTAIVTFTTKPVFAPIARMEVDPRGENFSLDGGAAMSDGEYLETQAQNLKSDRLAISVIRKLKLDANPELVPDAKTRAKNQFQDSPSADVLHLTPSESAALGAFHGRLTVKRDSASRLISVSFATHDPALSASITNTILKSFIEQSFEDQSQAVTKSTEWLSKQLDDIRQRMEESNRVLAEYQDSVGVADIGDDRNTFAEQVSELNRQLTQAQADRIQLQALLENVQRNSPDSLPEVRNNPVVQQLSEKLADVKTQLSQAVVTYGTNHPTVKKLLNQRDELEAQLSSQKLAVLSSIRTSFAAAHAREQMVNSQVKGATEQLNRMGKYTALKHEAKVNSELYNSLYAKVKEAGISAASRSSNLRIIDEARSLSSPTKPNVMMNLAVGLMAGLLGGIAIAFVREQIDSRIFTPDDLRRSIGNSNVAILPLFANGENGTQKTLAAKNPAALGPAGKLVSEVRFLIERPNSPEAEAMQSLYASLMFARNNRPPQVVLVVSSFPGEGKTTVASNLAIAMAQRGKTCIVDADLRRGHVARSFGISREAGLTDVLGHSLPLDCALAEVPNVPNLTVLPAHAGSPHAGQMVSSEKMRAVIAELRKRFQYVIVDSAPLLPFADGRVLSTISDGLVFVGRSGITTRDVLRRSVELLNEVHGAPILEFVLNAADLSSAPYRYYGYGYNYTQVGS